MSLFPLPLQKVLNEENYTVWIDGAGIRAGHKWRNEIADGIQVCVCACVHACVCVCITYVCVCVSVMCMCLCVYVYM